MVIGVIPPSTAPDLKVDRSSASPENERLVLESAACAPNAAAAPIDAISSVPRDGSRRKSLSVPVNRLPVPGDVPHGDVWKPTLCACAGAALTAAVAATVAQVHNILTIDLIVIFVLPPFARIQQDAIGRHEAGSTRPPAPPMT